MPKLSFRRRERRYLTQDEAVVAGLLGELRARSPKPLAAYEVTSTYLDTAAGTWSAGAAYPDKFRLRTYGPEAEAAEQWFEVKTHKGGVTTKRRRKLRPGADDWLGRMLTPVARVRYTRLAWERSGLRVTVDEAVTHLDTGRLLAGWVVEVKTLRPIPKWLAALLPPEAKRWNKSTWALGNRVEDHGKITQLVRS